MTPDSGPALTRRTTGRRLWVMVAALLAVGGVAGSVLAARSVAATNATRASQAAQRSAEDIASTLQLTIHDQESLIVHAGAFILENPDATVAQLARWMAEVRGFERYPEFQGIGEVVIVPAAELANFAARKIADGTWPPTMISAAQLEPPGDRPFYCLSNLGFGRDQRSMPAAGFDFCADPTVSAAITTARDSGVGSYEPVPVTRGLTWLGVQVPIYRGGAVPATVEARREAFVGVLGMFLNQSSVLSRALLGHPELAATMTYGAGTSIVEFSSGPVHTAGRDVIVDLQNGWTVHVLSAAPDGGLLSGTALWMLVGGVAVSLLLAALVLILGTGRALALRHVADRTHQLQYQALHDTLTGLPNRALIMDRAEQLLTRSRRQGTTGAALFIDLDDFKNVNDTLGHQAGDRLLTAVATRMTNTLRDADTIGRMGGDEFVVLIDGARSNGAPELVAERLIAVMRQPFELDGAPMALTVNTSIGIATGDRASGGDLLRDADVALYRAKGAGKNRFEIFLPEMHTEISRRVALESGLRTAIENDQFHLAYQPIYNLDDLTVVGVEALLRWDHPTLGAIEPDEFIPILEQTGQIHEVGRWVLVQGCRQMAEWHAQGDTLDLSVNVSGRQLDDDAVIDHISDALSGSGLPAESLIIEITETALMRNTQATAKRLQAIKALGVRIAVDDFGTGYSSLAYLQQFPVDCLKIDRSFTNALSVSPESKALVGTLVQLGKDLGLSTLAEGVETSGQMDHLRSEHVNQAQGFLLSRPLDPETLESRLLEPLRRSPERTTITTPSTGGAQLTAGTESSTDRNA